MTAASGAAELQIALRLPPRVAAALDRLDSIRAAASRQAIELQDFVEGRRRSAAPLGIKFLMNLGHDLELLVRDIEYWAKEQTRS